MPKTGRETVAQISQTFDQVHESLLGRKTVDVSAYVFGGGKATLQSLTQPPRIVFKHTLSLELPPSWVHTQVTLTKTAEGGIDVTNNLPGSNRCTHPLRGEAAIETRRFVLEIGKRALS